MNSLLWRGFYFIGLWLWMLLISCYCDENNWLVNKRTVIINLMDKINLIFKNMYKCCFCWKFADGKWIARFVLRGGFVLINDWFELEFKLKFSIVNFMSKSGEKFGLETVRNLIIRKFFVSSPIFYESYSNTTGYLRVGFSKVYLIRNKCVQ